MVRAPDALPVALRRPRRPGGGLPWPAAHRLAGEAAAPLAAVRRQLAMAVGRVLAEDLSSRVALPSADVSAMDGWAVAGPPPWRVVGERRLVGGEAVAIRTGAPVPPGCHAVLPVEESLSDGRTVWAVETPAPGAHVRRAGEEAARGDLLMAAGHVLHPPAVGLAAAGGHDSVLVRPAASVTVLVLGDELVSDGLPPPGRPRDALGPQLPGWLQAYGAELTDLRRLADDLTTLTRALRAGESRVTITTGGTSVGVRDHVRAAARAAGARVLVDGVDVRPGHPMLLASLPDDRWLISLPGNPLAACVALVTLAGPLLGGLHGVRRPELAARLTVAQPPRDGDGHRLVPVRPSSPSLTRLVGDVELLPSCGAAMLRGLAKATGLLVVPPEGAAPTDLLPYLPLPWTDHPREGTDP
jgi:molybdopterin molybdotransferase